MSLLLFAQLSGAGPAIIVVCSLALLGIIGFFFAAYLAHCFLLVVIESAAGINEIRWPSESINDWLTKPLYVLWVLLPILFVPSLLLAITGHAFTFGITLVILLWLVSPVMFLSSLAAQSWMSLLYGPFLWRWLRYLFAYAIFLVWSGTLIGLGVALLVWSMISVGGVALAAVFLPVLVLLYSRILGRYAWYVTTRRMRGGKKKMVPAEVAPVKVQSVDPWAISGAEETEAHGTSMISKGEVEGDGEDSEAPAVRAKLVPADEEETIADEEDEWSPNKKPYGVMTEQQAQQSWVERPVTDGSDNEGYSVEHMSIGAPVSLWQYYADREKKEEELRAQGKSVRQYERPRKPPTLWQAMTQEIAPFLFFSHSMRAWINLSLLFGVTLALLNTIVHITGIISRL
jgi:hypothetical protein